MKTEQHLRRKMLGRNSTQHLFLSVREREEDRMINRSFSLLLWSRIVSVFGDRLFLPAVFWMILDQQSGSSANLGVVSFVLAVPPFFSALIGVYVDRSRKKRMMVTCDLLRLGLCLLLYADALWWGSMILFVVVMFLIELIGMFFNLAAQSSIPSIVDREKLMKANSQMSLSDSFTSIAGYALGGALVAWLGSEAMILANGVTFLVSGLLLLGLKLPELQEESSSEQAAAAREKRSFWKEIATGVRTSLGDRFLVNLLVVAFVLNAASASMSMMMTMWAHDTLKLDASGYGVLLVSMLLGSLCGGLLSQVKSMERIPAQLLLVSGIVLYGLSLVGLSSFVYKAASIGFFFLGGVFVSVIGIAFSTYFMKHVSKENIAKIFGLVQMVTRGGQPLGIFIVTSLLAFTAPKTVFLGMGLVMLSGGAFLFVIYWRNRANL